ncbi:uncharacterized protein LOC133722915 [Rosa rugosa]|uniref:uncharacterized protein LOC133722915 n=1 Tax=Rosa rugosa TaxID=74645 RepID=UPI002B409F08|nr:uncharacterized protein LOC133722915 [Rosa rugosa]
MTVTNNTKALILIMHHMNESPQLEYMNEDNVRNLWVALQERFGNIRDFLLQDLEVQRHNLRFSDKKTVMEYNSEAFHINSLMQLCGTTITEAQLIEKTLSTIPVSALMVSKSCRIDVTSRQIIKFHELITTMSIPIKHDNILVKNYDW